MNQNEANRSVADVQQVAGQEMPQGVSFTRAEWQKLAFLRWLYRTGRLSDWPEGEPGR